MPLLANPRHEAFAQARARGAYLEDAYEDAGFAPNRAHASRLAHRPEVAERIGAIRAELAGVIDHSPEAMVANLLQAFGRQQGQRRPSGQEGGAPSRLLKKSVVRPDSA